MSPEPEVSVIITSYNNAAYLETAVESVLAQTVSNYEIILVNNGSQDSTDSIARRYESEGKIRYCFLRENQKAAGARNAGMRLSLGRYIALLDADDVWFPERLERSLRFLEEHPEVGLVHGAVTVIDAFGKPDDVNTRQIQKYYRRERRKGSGFLRFLDKSSFLTSTITFRKECLDKVGLYDTEFPTHEDYDWCLRFSAYYAIGLLEDDRPVARYRMYPGNYTKRFDEKTTAGIYLDILEKQLVQLETRKQDPRYRMYKSRILAKKAEFHWIRRDKAKVKENLAEAFRLDPRVLFNFDAFKRLLFSL
ncbi:MAG: glycosyltransferase [Candidatus Omnitrophica bacterium]|nr:glycosyltransferase [Candidatus Omnitrophota bacterium]